MEGRDWGVSIEVYGGKGSRTAVGGIGRGIRCPFNRCPFNRCPLGRLKRDCGFAARSFELVGNLPVLGESISLRSVLHARLPQATRLEHGARARAGRQGGD